MRFHPKPMNKNQPNKKKKKKKKKKKRDPSYMCIYSQGQKEEQITNFELLPRGATELIELATVGEDNKGNFSITQN